MSAHFYGRARSVKNIWTFSWFYLVGNQYKNKYWIYLISNRIQKKYNVCFVLLSENSAFIFNHLCVYFILRFRNCFKLAKRYNIAALQTATELRRSKKLDAKERDEGRIEGTISWIGWLTVYHTSRGSIKKFQPK